MRNTWKVDGHLATKTVECSGDWSERLADHSDDLVIDLRTLQLSVYRFEMCAARGGQRTYKRTERPARWDELAEVFGIDGGLLVRARWAMSLADYEVDVRRHRSLGHVSLAAVEDARLNAVWSAEAAVQVRNQLMKALEAFK